MKAKLYVGYAAVAYLLGLASITYVVGFLIDFGVPKGIGDGLATPPWTAIAVDAALVLGFGLHHSITARRSFKRWWTRIVPAPIERATYLCMTAAMTAALVVLWRPIPITVWNVDALWARGTLYALYLGVWGLMFASTFAVGHFRFFGLTQAWEELRNKPKGHDKMSVRFLYAIVRHPISVGWMVTPLVVPHLTVGHLVFAASTFVYIMLATPFEEADLIEEFGEEYESYKARVPAFLPRADRAAPSEIESSAV